MPQDVMRALLLIDDEPAQCRLITAIAKRAGWRLIHAATIEAALTLLASKDAGQVEAILLDIWSAADTDARLTALNARCPRLPVVVLTAQDSVALAVAAMRAGATDFLVKPIAPDRLLAALDAVAGAHPVAGELRPLTEKIRHPLAFADIVGDAPDFRAALGVAAKAARTHVPVLIEGESGVGKEVVAQAIHAASPRATRPLVVVHCGAIPENLVESELFGHEKGAFTGAFARHAGRFEEADGGTLFLDEIGEMPFETQVKLLRVLQTGEIRPIGARATRFVDVRVIAATNRTLAHEVEAGRFREDLYYRLNVVQVTLPPLRARPADIAPLARHLLARIGDQPGMTPIAIARDTLDLLAGYAWPGNVRQLHNALFRAAVLCGGDTLLPCDFPQIAKASASPGAGVATVPGAPVTLFEANGHLRPLEAIEADVIRLAIGHY
ncbi:MAG TPA: sigma-54 dependent transcriptional regulator, partial [Sphingomonadaceae bacterium]|nr:sigma-54 dependent transcriptional regulator [Sphingomonadaceae bacterium]